MFKRGTAAVTQIYNDLKRIDGTGSASSVLHGISEELQLSTAAIDDVMPYGVAMLLAQNEGDGDSQALFASIYSRKRASVSRKTKTISDVLPRGGF